MDSPPSSNPGMLRHRAGGTAPRDTAGAGQERGRTGALCPGAQLPAGRAAEPCCEQLCSWPAACSLPERGPRVSAPGRGAAASSPQHRAAATVPVSGSGAAAALPGPGGGLGVCGGSVPSTIKAAPAARRGRLSSVGAAARARGAAGSPGNGRPVAAAARSRGVGARRPRLGPAPPPQPEAEPGPRPGSGTEPGRGYRRDGTGRGGPRGAGRGGSRCDGAAPVPRQGQVGGTGGAPGGPRGRRGGRDWNRNKGAAGTGEAARGDPGTGGRWDEAGNRPGSLGGWGETGNGPGAPGGRERPWLGLRRAAAVAAPAQALSFLGQVEGSQRHRGPCVRAPGWHHEGTGTGTRAARPQPRGAALRPLPPPPAALQQPLDSGTEAGRAAPGHQQWPRASEPGDGL